MNVLKAPYQAVLKLNQRQRSCQFLLLGPCSDTYGELHIWLLSQKNHVTRDSEPMLISAALLMNLKTKCIRQSSKEGKRLFPDDSLFLGKQ